MQKKTGKYQKLYTNSVTKVGIFLSSILMFSKPRKSLVLDIIPILSPVKEEEERKRKEKSDELINFIQDGLRFKEPTGNLQTWIEKGNDFIIAKKYDDAVNAYLNALFFDPNSKSLIYAILYAEQKREDTFTMSVDEETGE